MSELVQCYNRNCGQKFDPANNGPEACTFHSGEPFFHDAYKGWSCCKRKATDFTEFLNFKGCTKGPHNPVKPPEPEKPKKSDNFGNGDVIEKVEAPKPPKPRVAASRDSASNQKNDLKKIITASAKTNFEKLTEELKALKSETGKGETEKTSDGGGESEVQKVEPGTSCKNNSCTTSYQTEASNSDPCFYHPGIPVFHEGMKFWSCCKKRTTDFEAFMHQMGCTKGNHKWFKEEDEDGDRKLECKKDFHQTPSHVILTVYAKNSDPHESHVLANPVSLTVHVQNMENKVLNMDIPLWGEIVPEDSSVTFTPSKVELKLKKAEPMSWLQYEYTP